MLTLVIRERRSITEHGLKKINNPDCISSFAFHVIGTRRLHVDVVDLTSGCSIRLKEEIKRAIVEVCRDEGMISESVQISVIGRCRGFRGYCSLFNGEYCGGQVIESKKPRI